MGQYLVKLWARVRCLVFLTHSVDIPQIQNKSKYNGVRRLQSVDRRVVNSHDASAVVDVVNKLDRRRVLMTRSICCGEIF